MLITTAGAYSSNSFVTLAEAESILSFLGLQTEAWNALTAQAGIKTQGSVAGPFSITPGIRDSLKLSLVDGDDEDQTITFSGDPEILSASALCIAVNSQLQGITFVPTAAGKITIEVTEPTDTLYIKAIDKSLYSILGIIPGTYANTVDSRKEFMLQLAAQLVGMLPLSGRKIFQRQALAFPRVSWSTRDNYSDTSRYIGYGDYMNPYILDPYSGYNITEISTIPNEVKESQAILACLVVQPMLDKQPSMSSDLYLPEGLQNSVVNSVNVAGIMQVKTQIAASSSNATANSSLINILASMTNVFCMPVYLRMKQYLTQIGGGILRSPQDDAFVLLPPVDPELDWLSIEDLATFIDGGSIS